MIHVRSHKRVHCSVCVLAGVFVSSTQWPSLPNSCSRNSGWARS